MHAIDLVARPVTARSDEDLYAKVIEIAQEQAQASSAQTELHRQNVTRADTMTALLSAQTTTMVAISTAIQHMNESNVRDLQHLKDHVSLTAATQDAKTAASERSWKFLAWLATTLIAGSTILAAVVNVWLRQPQ